MDTSGKRRLSLEHDIDLRHHIQTDRQPAAEAFDIVLTLFLSLALIQPIEH